MITDFFKRLSPTAEFGVVLLITFGWFISTSFEQAFGLSSLADRGIVMTDGRLMKTLLYELAVGGLACSILALRNWKLSDFNLNITWQTTIDAFPLIVLVTFSYWIVALVALSIGGRQAVSHIDMTSQATLIPIVLFSIVNGFFEEVFVVGYIIKRLGETEGAVVTILTSTFVRFLYHLYQGPIAIASIVPIGLIFGTLYWKRRQLWPLVLVHIVWDVLGLLNS